MLTLSFPSTHRTQRKATTTPKDKNGRKPQAAEKSRTATQLAPLSTAKGGVVHQAKSSATPPSYSYKHNAPAVPQGNSQQAIAQAAVGRGIRHSIGLGSARAPTATTTEAPPANTAPENSNYAMQKGVQDSLSQLANNYQNSIGDLPTYPEDVGSQDQQHEISSSAAFLSSDPFASLVSRNSSLIDLAMIPTLDDGEPMPSIPGMNFVDFPQPEVDPSNAYLGPDQQHEGSG